MAKFCNTRSMLVQIFVAVEWSRCINASMLSGWSLRDIIVEMRNKHAFNQKMS